MIKWQIIAVKPIPYSLGSVWGGFLASCYVPGYEIEISRFSPEEWNKAHGMTKLGMRIDDTVSRIPKKLSVKLSRREARELADRLLEQRIEDCIGRPFEMSYEKPSNVVAMLRELVPLASVQMSVPV